MAKRKAPAKDITKCLKYVGIGILVLSLLTALTGRKYVKEYEAEFPKAASENGNEGEEDDIMNKFTSDSSKDTKKAVSLNLSKKTPITGDSVPKKIGFYEDASTGNDPFINKSNEKKLITGFKNFYKKTGVYPYLYIIESSEYPAYDLSIKYRELFDDNESCLVILYVVKPIDRHGIVLEDNYYIGAGKEATAIVDTEMLTALSKMLDSKWNGKTDLAEMFGSSLSDIADNMMYEKE